MVKPFSLYAVLKYRKQDEEKAAMRLGKALKNFRSAQERLKALLLDSQRLNSKIQQIQNEGVEIHTLLYYQSRKEYLQKQFELASVELEKRKLEVTRARSVTITKSKERQVMEQLKEKQDREYKHLS